MSKHLIIVCQGTKSMDYLHDANNQIIALMCYATGLLRTQIRQSEFKVFAGLR